MIYVIAQAGIPWADLSPVVAVGLIFLAVLLALLRHNASREKMMADAIDKQATATDKVGDSLDFLSRILVGQSIGLDAMMRLVAKGRNINVDDLMRESRAAADSKLGPLNHSTR